MRDFHSSRCSYHAQKNSTRLQTDGQPEYIMRLVVAAGGAEAPKKAPHLLHMYVGMWQGSVLAVSCSGQI